MLQAISSMAINAKTPTLQQGMLERTVISPNKT
jgi:hypothetical protein